MSVRGVSSDPKVVSDLAGVGRLPPAGPDSTPARAGMDQGSVIWLERLRAAGADRDAALGELHALLLRAARFEVRRRNGTSAHLVAGDQDDLAQQSADDALVAILGKLGDFRGESRFTTWAYKFALYETAAKMRRKAWQGREVSLEPEIWPLIADERQRTPHEGAETAELLTVIQAAIERELSPHQREVLVAIALNDVPIDVLAERLNTTRGALYKTVYDARQKLRASLAARGLSADDQPRQR